VLFGPSGSGKSLTLKLIAGFEKPDEGFVLSCGKDITHLPPEERNIAYLPQNLGLFPHFTVKENLLYPFKCQKKKIDTSFLNEVIERFEIKGILNKNPGVLSGGEKQRVALAGAILSNPELLLLDEPLSSLDFQLKLKLAQFLKKIKKDFKLTVIHVTHDPVEALFLPEKIIFIEKGKLQSPEKFKDIFKNFVEIKKYLTEI